MQVLLCYKWDLAAWGVICLFFAASHELTVRSTDLKPCATDRRVCVTDLKDCDLPPLTSRLAVPLNMSCYYQTSGRLFGSMTCDWSRESDSHTEPVYSLIFSRKTPVDKTCKSIFTPIAIINVTVRIKNYMWEGETRDTWSRPHTENLYHAVKASQPVLTIHNSTVDSVVVSWRSSEDGSCQLRYRVNTTHTWTQVPGPIPVEEESTLVHTIRNLRPFTVYSVAVACREESGYWSDWSSEVTGRTLERVPSKPPEVCYRVEKGKYGGSLLLHLMWKALEQHEAGGRILGYQVSYTPKKKQQLQQSESRNTTGLTALLGVEEGHYSVSVAAFNMAGFGPAAHLSINTNTLHILPSVRSLWVLSSFLGKKGLLVQWEIPQGSGPPANHLAPPPDPPIIPLWNPALPVNHLALPPASVIPVSQFAVQWSSETDPSSSHWTRVDGFTYSTVIRDHLDPDQTYSITVFPIYSQQCGSPQSLPARLEHGARVEAVKLKVVNVGKTTATAVWAWQRNNEPIRVDKYRVVLRMESEKHDLLVWPDQSQHTFVNLRANTEYSLLLLADNVTRMVAPFKTDFDESTAVATATPLLLLAVIVLVVCILSRTVYKTYFFPPISSPRGSTAGQWLMDANGQKGAVRSILDKEDFQVDDVFLEVGPDIEDDLHGHTPPPSLSHLIIKYSALHLNTEYIADNPTEHMRVSLCNPDYVVNHPEGVAPEAEESQEASRLPPPCQPDYVVNSHFPERDEGFSQPENVVNCRFHESISTEESHGRPPMTCETEYVVNSYYPEKLASEQRDCPHMLCDPDYI